MMSLFLDAFVFFPDNAAITQKILLREKYIIINILSF